MSTITAKDGTEIYYKDWGQGPVVTFSHGWPRNADAWDGQLLKDPGWLRPSVVATVLIVRTGRGA